MKEPKYIFIEKHQDDVSLHYFVPNSRILIEQGTFIDIYRPKSSNGMN